MRLLIHLETEHFSAFMFEEGKLNTIIDEQVSFCDYYYSERLMKTIDYCLSTISRLSFPLKNSNTSIYATGIFQRFNETERVKLINNVFVDYGLYFYIVPQDLEKFYMERSFQTFGFKDVIHGVIQQEFRKVVICGSFQQYLTKFESIMGRMHDQGTIVLSPWTTKVRPETLGTDFILLEGQDDLKNERDTWRHKYEHMNKFRLSDAIILCNPEGFIGKGTIFELGFMIALGKRIIFMEQPKGLTIHFPYEVGLNCFQ